MTRFLCHVEKLLNKCFQQDISVLRMMRKEVSIFLLCFQFKFKKIVSVNFFTNLVVFTKSWYSSLLNVSCFSLLLI